MATGEAAVRPGGVGLPLAQPRRVSGQHLWAQRPGRPSAPVGFRASLASTPGTRGLGPSKGLGTRLD